MITQFKGELYRADTVLPRKIGPLTSRTLSMSMEIVGMVTRIQLACFSLRTLLMMLDE